MADQIVLPGQPLAGPSSSSAAAPVLGAGTYRRGPFVLSSLVGRVSRSEAPVASSSRLGSAMASGKGKAPQGAQDQPAASTLAVQGATARFPIPDTDSVVLARITRVSPREARCSILAVNGVPCGLNASALSGLGGSASGGSSAASASLLLGISASDDGNPDNLFQGVIRSQDVRATNKDSVRMNEMFRPGDIVRAVVISLGDARSYYLSTASNELGVVYAIAASSTAPDYVLIDDDLPAAAGSSASSRPAAAETSAAEVMSRPSAVPLQPLNWAEMQDPSTGAIEKRKVAKPLVV